MLKDLKEQIDFWNVQFYKSIKDFRVSELEARQPETQALLTYYANDKRYLKSLNTINRLINNLSTGKNDKEFVIRKCQTNIINLEMVYKIDMLRIEGTNVKKVTSHKTGQVTIHKHVVRMFN